MNNLRRLEVTDNLSARLGLIVCLVFCCDAYAGDTGTLIESQADTQSCRLYDPDYPPDGYVCEIVTAGNYTLRFSWSAESLSNAGFSLDNLNPDGSDMISIKIGSFTFNGVISDAPGYVISADKLSATWITKHVVCNKNPICDIGDPNSPGAAYRTDTTVTLSGGNNGLTLMLNGKSHLTDGILDWGKSIEGPGCVSNGNTAGNTGSGPMGDSLSLEIGGVTLTANVNVSCKVKTKTVTDKSNKRQTFQLTSVLAKAKLVHMLCP